MRTKLIALLMVLVILSGLLPTSAPKAQELTDVTQVGFLVIDLAPMFIGIEKGYFKEEGLNLRFVEIDSGQLGVGAVATGLAQFVDLGVEDILDLQAQKKDVVLMYSMVNSLTMDMVVRNEVLEKKGVSRKSPIKERFAALKGMKIGITRPGAPTQLYPKWFLQQAGLDPEKDAEFVTIGNGAALLAALEAGKIDAYMLSAPTPILAEQKGFAKLFIMNSAGDVPQTKEFAFESIAVLRKWAEANPKAVEGYSRAMDKANKFLVDNTEEAVKIIKDKYFPDTDIETVRISLKALLPAMNPEGKLSEEGIKNQLQVAKDLGSLKEMPDTSEGKLWTNKWNPDMKK